MKKESPTNETFARQCLQQLRRDLSDSTAIATLNKLDIALRRKDIKTFTAICGSLPDIVKEDCEPWMIRERLQVVSLIRFPLTPLDEEEFFMKQRASVLSLTIKNLSPSDNLIIRHASRLIRRFLIHYSLRASS